MEKYAAILLTVAVAFALTVGSVSSVMSNEWSSNSAEFRASKIRGASVRDENGKKFGEIRDLVIDPQAPGHILFAVVRPGRSLEFSGDRLLAIPFGALTARDPRHYDLHMSREMIRKAPSFDEDHWPNLQDRSWSADVYRYFGQSPYWTDMR